MTAFNRTLASATVICISLAWGTVGYGAIPAELKDSAAAQPATIRYEKDVAAAKQEFQAKLQLLRQDYEGRTVAARKAYVASLKTAQGEETKKGKLELAIAIKDAVTKWEAQGGLTWPEQILPENVDAPKAQAAPPAPANVGKTIKSYSEMTKFADEAAVRKAWTLPEEKKDWQLGNDLAILNARNASIHSRYRFKGDMALMIQCTPDSTNGYPSFTVRACGEEIARFRGDNRKHQIEMERKGGSIRVAVDGKESFIKSKESDLATAFPVEINCDKDGRRLTITAIGVRAAEAEPEAATIPAIK